MTRTPVRRGVLAAIGALLVLVGLATPANAAAGWADSTQGQQTYTIRDDSGTVDIVKIVIAVQYFSATDTSDLSKVTAVRTRCSVRNLNTSKVSGVRVDDCAVGYNGGSTLRTCDSSCPALDGGGCCANGYSGLRYVNYEAGGDALRGRGTITYRGAVSGTYYTANWLSNPTSQSWYVK